VKLEELAEGDRATPISLDEPDHRIALAIW